MAEPQKDDRGTSALDRPSSSGEEGPLLPQVSAARSPSLTPSAAPGGPSAHTLAVANMLLAAGAFGDSLATAIIRHAPGWWIFVLVWSLFAFPGNTLLATGWRRPGRAEGLQRRVREPRWHAGLALAWVALEACLSLVNFIAGGAWPQYGLGRTFTLLCVYVVSPSSRSPSGSSADGERAARFPSADGRSMGHVWQLLVMSRDSQYQIRLDD